MDKLKETLIAHGISAAALCSMDEAQLCNLAKAFGIDARGFLPRKVRIEEGANGAQYLVTEAFSVPKYANKQPVKGESTLSRNLYVRVEAIDQIIADLTAAKGLLKQ